MRGFELIKLTAPTCVCVFALIDLREQATLI